MTPRASMKLVQEPSPIPILYLDDDIADAEHAVRELALSVSNPVHTFMRPQELYDFLDMNEGPFIILVDLVLFDDEHVGGGYEIIQRLRRRPDITDTRSAILAVTSTPPSDDLIERVKQTGADAFIHKPVQSDDLVTIIGRPGWFLLEVKRPS